MVKTTWLLVIIAPVPPVTRCSFMQSKVEFTAAAPAPAGLATPLQFILPTFPLADLSAEQTILHNESNTNYGQSNTNISFPCRSTLTC